MIPSCRSGLTQFIAPVGPATGPSPLLLRVHFDAARTHVTWGIIFLGLPMFGGLRRDQRAFSLSELCELMCL